MISIVIATLNEEEVISNTLSRIQERVRDIQHEIIVSDDGSTDETVQQAREYADRVVSYAGEMPQTIAATRNRGAAAARFPIIAFFDSDVRLRDRDFFPKVLHHFNSDPKLVCMTVSTRIYPETETRADKIVLGFYDLYFRLANNVFGFGLTHGKCVIVRATAFKQIGGFKETLVASEDADLFMRLCKIGRPLLDPSLRIYHSGRRAHALGWPRLLTIWTLNGLWITFLGRSWSKQWAKADRDL